MTSEQKYEGGGDHANQPNVNGSITERTAQTVTSTVTPDQSAASSPPERNPAIPAIKVDSSERVCVPIADSLFADALSNPATATTIRTSLRTWYLGAIGDEYGWGGPEHEQTRVYELLDELLALCTLNALNSTNRLAPAPESVSQFITDFFLDPATVLEMRRNLRVWFLIGVQTHEDNIGTTLEVQIGHYEVLDEVLTSLVVKQLPV